MLSNLKKAGLEGRVDAAIVQQSFGVSWPAMMHKGGEDLSGKPPNLLKNRATWEVRKARQGIVPMIDDNLDGILSMA